MKQSELDALRKTCSPELVEGMFGEADEAEALGFAAPKLSDEPVDVLKAIESTVTPPAPRQPVHFTAAQEIEYSEFLKAFPVSPSRLLELRKKFIQQLNALKSTNESGWQLGIQTMHAGPVRKMLLAIDEGDSSRAETHVADLVTACACD